MKLILLVALCALLGAQAAPMNDADYEEISSYIVNGARAVTLPYIAFVQYTNAQGLGFFGAGALVTNQHIVTSATSIVGFTTWAVHLGSANRTAMRQFGVNLATPHPGYIALTRANDIGVMRLVQSVMFTADISAISLPPNILPPAEPLILPLENEEGLIAGFGFNSEAGVGPSAFAYHGFQRVISTVRCLQFFNHNPNQVFCGEDVNQRTNVCTGDFGAPFVLQYRYLKS